GIRCELAIISEGQFYTGAAAATALNAHFREKWNIVRSFRRFKTHRQCERPEAPLQQSEVVSAMKKCRANTAPGADNIPNEVWKHSNAGLQKALWLTLKRVWDGNHVPIEWNMTKILPLYKGKGSRLSANNYRGISLLPTAAKILSRVIATRVNMQVEDQISSSQ